MSGRAENQIESRYVPNVKVLIGIRNEKRCTKCGIEKPLNEFYPLKAGIGGRHSWCRICANQDCKDRHLKNPEKKRESDRRYRERNIERIREYDRNRVRDPIERKKAIDKWQSNNPGRSREIKRKWEKNNPEKVMDHSRRKRAKRKNAIIEKFPAQEIFERDQWVCQICHKRVNKKLKWPNPMSPSLDHIKPISKGGSHERKNTQLTHLGCNMKASDGGIKQTRLF